jgi:hypothetical protein
MRVPTETAGTAALIGLARERAGTEGTIIAFADSRYLEVLMNWLVALAAHRIENYLIIALDRRLYAFLQARGLPVVLSALDGDLRALWIRRIEVFSDLCAAGVDFVHSDVDAVWLRDPRDQFLNDREADLTISQGTVWPPDVHRRFGFVLCCGLFRLRSTPRTQQLLGELRHHVSGTGDDQVSLNQLVAARDPRWEIAQEQAYYTEGNGLRFLCCRSAIRATGADGLRISVLPHHLFQRLPVVGPEPPYVQHLLTPKDPDAKLRAFAQHGALLLRPDWADVGFDASSVLRLRRSEFT